MTDNPYDVLGLDASATSDEINAAFRDKAKKAHPDQGGSTEEFQRVKSASLVLLDPVRRKKFDETGEVDSDKADNTMAEVMEAIANFFISSLDALDQPMAPRLEQVDLVAAACQHFNNQVAGAKQHILGIDRKVAKFEKSLARLKSKREPDQIRQMLTHHVNHLKNAAALTKAQIKQFEMAIVILKDYEFEAEKTPPDPYRSILGQRGFFST